MFDLSINTELGQAILTGFIKSEISRVGYQRAVIGLSGGIDSAVSCFLAVEALGPKNVLAVCMPYKNSSPNSLDHAQITIDKLGISSVIIPITEMVEPMFLQFPKMSQVRRGNVMARQRMIVLYDQSEETKGLVVGTGNKTEILLGYTTLFGNSACALNILFGDLYKTQVRQLAEYLGVPEKIIAKPPSADLWFGQTDEGELGFSYAEVDKLLFLLVDQRFNPEECVEAGFDKKFVEVVVSRIKRYHYKRVMPPIAKISNRTIGYDFLYLRDWGT